jgi:hypothetical protein
MIIRKVPRLVLAWFLNKNTRQNIIYPFLLQRFLYIYRNRRYEYFTPTELLGKETDKNSSDGAVFVRRMLRKFYKFNAVSIAAQTSWWSYFLAVAIKTEGEI